MEVIPPEYSLVGMVAPLEFHCSTALVHPAPRLSWTVRDWEDTELDHQELSTNMSSLLHSHWSSSNETRLSLVESFRVLLAAAVFCHKEPARASKAQIFYPTHDSFHAY